MAEILRCDKHRVYGWLRTGWLRGFHVGAEARAWLCTGAAILDLVHRLENGKYGDEDREEWDEMMTEVRSR